MNRYPKMHLSICVHMNINTDISDYFYLFIWVNIGYVIVGTFSIFSIFVITFALI